MARNSWYAQLNITNDATFRSLLSPVSAAIASSGWTQSYTNINWTTVLKPGTANTIAGKEIWAMGDSLQATAPKYMLIEYWTGTDASTAKLWLTVGTGIDGSGNLTGQISSRFNIAIGYFPGSFTSRWCGNNNFFVVMFAVDASNTYQAGFSVERDHATSGVDTEKGLLVFTYYNVTANSQFIPTTGTISQTMAHWNSSAPPAGTGAIGADIYLYPIRAWAFGETCASLCFFHHFPGDLTANNATPCTLWDGNSHTIISNGSSLTSNTNMFYGGTVAPVMRWE